MIHQAEIKFSDTPFAERSLLDVLNNPLGIDRGALLGFTDPDTGPRQRNVTGADAPKLEEYSQTQQFIGKAAAELFEGGTSPTLGSGLREIDELRIL